MGGNMSAPIVHGLYTVKDQYFKDFQRPYWVDNKNERRPYYYLLKDWDDISWLIPMSTQAKNYQAKITRIEEKRGIGNCVYYHIGKVASIDRVFLIGDMFPVDESYIKAPFIIGSVHYISRDRKLNSIIYSKAMRFLKLVGRGAIKSRNDIMGIKKELISRRQNQMT